MEILPEPKPVTPAPVEQPKTNKNIKPRAGNKSFVKWFETVKPQLSEEFPNLDSKLLTKTAFERFKEECKIEKEGKVSEDETNKKIVFADHKENVNGETLTNGKNSEDEISRKRKLNDDQNDENNQPKRSAAASKLAAFARPAQ